MIKKTVKFKQENIISADKAYDFIGSRVPISKNFESCDCHIVTSMRFSHVENGKKNYDFSFLFPKATASKCKIKVFSTDPEIGSYIESEYLLTNSDIADIKKKKINFDILLTTVRDMSDLGAIYKILGPKKQVPTEIRGTLAKDTQHLKKLFVEWQSGQRRKASLNLKESCCDINLSLGKVNSNKEDIVENMNAFLDFLTKMSKEKQSFLLKTKYTFRITKVLLSTTQGKNACKI